MSSVPPTKKANVVDTAADYAVSSTGIDLSAELIARVATFASVWTPDVWNTCLAVGPAVSRAIRHSYLKNNTDFLEKTLEKFHSKAWRKAKARTNHLAWMAVNSDWRNKITDERMEDLKEATCREYMIQHKVYPYLAFHNPAIAIQLGLLDVLKYLVEEKLVDINSHQWTGYFSTAKLPLLCYCVGYEGTNNQWEQDLDTYHYLLELSSLDTGEHVDQLFVSLFPFYRSMINRSALPFIRGLVQNPAFSQRISDRLVTVDRVKESPLRFLLGVLLRILARPDKIVPETAHMLEDAYNCTKTLVEAGADPKRRNISGNTSASEYWKHRMDYISSMMPTRAKEKCRAEYCDKVTVLLESYQ